MCVPGFCRKSFGLRARVTLSEEQPIVITGEEFLVLMALLRGFRAAVFQHNASLCIATMGIFFGELFEGQGFRHGPPDYLFTQEIEMGLPYRFNVAAETGFRTIQWRRRREERESRSAMGSG